MAVEVAEAAEDAVVAAEETAVATIAASAEKVVAVEIEAAAESVVEAVAAKAAEGRGVRLSWAPSHRGEEAVARGEISEEDRDGRALADERADSAMAGHPSCEARDKLVHRLDTVVDGILRLAAEV